MTPRALQRTLFALSHFAAAWLAGRIGLVNTMRGGLNEMDVPTRVED